MQMPDFTSVRNHYEQAVFSAVLSARALYPAVGESPDLLVDVACVALNRVPARYIRHSVDLLFYLTDREREEFDRSVHEAVKHAFEFVQARSAMRARA
jgi:Late competence development protein ComFB